MQTGQWVEKFHKFFKRFAEQRMLEMEARPSKHIAKPPPQSVRDP